MKKNFPIFLLNTLLLVLCLAGFSACEKEKYVCSGPILDFKIEQQNAFWPDSLLECTKCVESGYIRFSIIDETSEVIKWRVGNDPREFTERAFSLYFENAVGKKIPITLFVEKYEYNANCEINYYQDSITKLLEFVPYFESRIFGKYKGYNTNEPNKEFIVEILDTIRITDPNDASLCIPFINPPIAYRVMRGLPSSCNDMNSMCDYPTFIASYDKFYFDVRTLSDECLAVHGRGTLSSDYNQVTIGYKTFDKYIGSERFEEEHTFIGYRIE